MSKVADERKAAARKAAEAAAKKAKKKDPSLPKKIQDRLVEMDVAIDNLQEAVSKLENRQDQLIEDVDVLQDLAIRLDPETPNHNEQGEPDAD